MRNKRLLIVLVAVLTLCITGILVNMDDKMDQKHSKRVHQHIDDAKETDVLDDSANISDRKSVV